MKKMFICVLLSITVCVCLIGCNRGNQTTAENENTQENINTQNNTSNTSNQTEINSVEDNTDNNTDIVNQTDSNEEQRNTTSFASKEAVTMINGNEEIELTVNSLSYENEIHSKSDNPYSQYFVDVKDETFLVIKTNIKNTSGETIGYNFFDNVKVIYEDKFNYDLGHIDIDSTVLSRYWSVEPLKTEEIYFSQSIPDELKGKPFKLIFSTKENDYVMNGK